MYKFKSSLKDEYSKLIDELNTNHTKNKKVYVFDTNTVGVKFRTNTCNIGSEPVYTVSPKTKKKDFINKVVQK